MGKEVKEYSIALSRENLTYFPGEQVQGTVNLVTTESIHFKAIRVSLQGRKFAKVSSGNNSDYYTNLFTFEEESCNTAYARTLVVQEGGKNVNFNPPWKPFEAVVTLSLPDDGKTSLVIQVQDSDLLKKDDLLGSVHVNVASIVSVDNRPITLTLSVPKGKSNKKSPDPTITLLAYWSTESCLERESEKKVLKIKFISALNLRSADWFSKNDVYVEVYEAPKDMGSSPTSAKPELRLLPPGFHYMSLTFVYFCLSQVHFNNPKKLIHFFFCRSTSV